MRDSMATLLAWQDRTAGIISIPIVLVLIFGIVALGPDEEPTSTTGSSALDSPPAYSSEPTSTPNTTPTRKPTAKATSKRPTTRRPTVRRTKAPVAPSPRRPVVRTGPPPWLT